MNGWDSPPSWYGGSEHRGNGWQEFEFGIRQARRMFARRHPSRFAVACRVVVWTVSLGVLIYGFWCFLHVVYNRLDRVPGHGAYSAEALLQLDEIQRMAPPVIVREDGLPPMAGGRFYAVHGPGGHEPADPDRMPR